VKEILIDAREMEHPEPLERGIAALRALDAQSYIYMLNQKNPIPLITLAKQHGFNTLSHESTPGEWHILISKQEEPLLKALLHV